jgi:signal transduction histidine kinase
MLTGALVWDARMCEIWGIPAPPDTYAAYLATMHPDDLERVKTLVEQCLTSGRFEEFEHRIVRPSGEVRHLHCRAIAVVDADRTTVGMRGGVFDVTDRKLLEERLRNAHRLQAVGELTAGIAHNFNNLLGIILPSVELCRGAPANVAAGYLDEIENAAERAAEMVRQLMQFGRHELGAPKRAVDLQAIVSRLVHVCRTTFEPHMTIACERSPGRLPILASAGEIEQVLLNVCINARDALRSAQVEAPVIHISLARTTDGRVRVQISDNGPGMRSEVRARIFEPFFTTKGIGSGTGLGLASAYGIMRDHGGTIVCESEPGRGTSFTIELPAAPESALAEPATRAQARGPGNSETVLLVDDEFALRRVLRIILEQAGFRVLEAHDGMAGLELVERRSEEVDVIVLDRSMPRLSGEQFLSELRRRDLQLPVVFLTGQGGSDVPSDAAIPVLLKPPASGELVRAIRAVLDRSERAPVS